MTCLTKSHCACMVRLLKASHFTNVPFLFGLQLALLTAGDFAQWLVFNVKISVALQSIFLAVTFMITFKTSYHSCLHKELFRNRVCTTVPSCFIFTPSLLSLNTSSDLDLEASRAGLTHGLPGQCSCAHSVSGAAAICFRQSKSNHAIAAGR